MAKPKGRFSVNVDLTNPGQFFACCGLLELADRLWPGAEGWFDDGVFHLADASGHGEFALDRLFRHISESPLRVDERRGERATQPVCFDAFALMLDWWLDPGDWTDFGQSRFKMWAGQQTALGIVEQLREPLQDVLATTTLAECLDFAAPLTGRFGLDHRSAWRALDTGFSPNEQGIEVGTYPAVELLGAVGLQGFRPRPNGEWQYGYSIWDKPLTASLARAAALGAFPGTVQRRWAFRIVKRGSYKGLGQSTPLELTNHA